MLYHPKNTRESQNSISSLQQNEEKAPINMYYENRYESNRKAKNLIDNSVIRTDVFFHPVSLMKPDERRRERKKHYSLDEYRKIRPLHSSLITPMHTTSEQPIKSDVDSSFSLYFSLDVQETEWTFSSSILSDD